MLRRNPSRAPSAIQLFCVPHAGNGPAAFRGWPADLHPEIDTILVELPGRESRFHEAPYDSMDALVRDLAGVIVDELTEDRPFALFGNSVGSLIAFETLHEVRRRTGREALHLFVSAAAAPQCEPVLPPIGHLPDRELIREVEFRYGGIPKQVLEDEEFLAIVLPTLRADIRLFEAYERRAPNPLGCPITAYGGRSDISVPQEHLEAWKAQTTSTFQARCLNEGHLFLQSARELLVQDMRQALLNSPTGVGGLR